MTKDGDDEALLSSLCDHFSRHLTTLPAQFADDEPLAIVLSSGRDRVLMGHVDFQGLGGFTVDCATREEMICFAQTSTKRNDGVEGCTHKDGVLLFTNSDETFLPFSLSVQDLLKVARDEKAFGTAVWPSEMWNSYVSACLAFMLSSRFEFAVETERLLNQGMRFHIVSDGPLRLSANGGVSSSAALTGSISLAVSTFSHKPFPLHSLAQVDRGEYYLGKFAGCADKMAQLYAKRGALSVIASHPERYIRSLSFPASISLIVAENDMPRLTLESSRQWLQTQYNMNTERIQQVLLYAKSIMTRFGSLVYVCAAQQLLAALQDSNLCEQAGISARQAQAVHQALLSNDSMSSREPLLRELCFSGAIEHELPELASWTNRFQRYKLIYRLLSLIPIRYTYQQSAGKPSYELEPRKAALYGLSEVERGYAYLQEIANLYQLESVNNQSHQINCSVERIIELVHNCHDGDRAVVDWRFDRRDSNNCSTLYTVQSCSFAPTSWSSNSNVLVTNETLQSWITGSKDLCECIGSFERSVANVDELIDELKTAFPRCASGRISAAGMGGRILVHCHSRVAVDVQAWLQRKGWCTRAPEAGAGTRVLSA